MQKERPAALSVVLSRRWLRAAEQSKIKTGAGKIKAGCSLERVTAGGAGKQVLGLLGPSSYASPVERYKHSRDKKAQGNNHLPAGKLTIPYKRYLNHTLIS